jgi:hypothetical protein
MELAYNDFTIAESAREQIMERVRDAEANLNNRRYVDGTF